MTIYFFDMGLKKYGDSILIVQGDRKILIDFGKPADQSSLRLQLKKVLEQDPPFHFDLLFVTHNHDDHIGAFPEMIAGEEITADKYVLIDPAYRWGREEETDSDSAVVRDGITEALLEEDHSDLSDEDLEVFLSDIEQTVVRYRRMIRQLKDSGAIVKLFRGRDSDSVFYDQLESEFESFGLKILGPSKKHLQITQKAQLGARDAIADFFEKSAVADAVQTRVDLYRKLFREGTVDNEFFLDARANSGSINNESIVIKVSEARFSALLAADMQFADPATNGIEAEMEALMQKVFDNGTYDVIKTCHHTSHNGLDEEMMDHWIGELNEGEKLFVVHSGGRRDEDHPDAEVLKMLKKRKSKIQFARTDRNGLIKAEKEDGELMLFLSKGTINNFTPNLPSDAAEEANLQEIGAAGGQLKLEGERKGPEVQQQFNLSTDAIELSAKIPVGIGKVTITLETENQKKKF